MKKYATQFKRKPSLKTFLWLVFYVLVFIGLVSMVVLIVGCSTYSMCGAAVNSVLHNVASVDVKGEDGTCKFEFHETGIDSSPGVAVVPKVPVP